MRSKKLTKTLAVLLSVLMIVVSLPLASMAASGSFNVPSGMYLISNTEKKIAPGVTENKIITNKADGQSQVTGYAVTVKMGEGSTSSLMAGYADYDGTTWKLQTVRNQASALEKKKNVNVVAAYNADIFNMQTGEPINTLVMDGRVVKDGFGKPYFAIMKDGTAKIGSSMTADVLANAKEAVGGFYPLVEGGRKTDYAYYTANFAPKTAVGIKADGNVVVYVADGRNAPFSVGLDDVDLADIMIGLGCVDVINLDGGGSTTYAAKYEGSDSLEVANRPSDGVERSVSSTLFVVSSAKPTGEFDHASIAPNDVLYTPGSTVKFSAIGVDSAGGKAPLPADGKFALAEESVAMGEISDDGVFVSNGTIGKVTVNYISGGKDCGSTAIEIQAPDEFFLPSADISLGFEETTNFGIVAKYKDVTVNMKAGDIEWAIADMDGNDISGQAGTFDGLTFTSFDGVTVNAMVTATSVFNSDISVQIKTVIGALPVIYDDFEYTTDADEAAANPELKYIPTTVMPKYDKTQYASHGAQAPVIYEQGYPYYTWPNGALGNEPQYMTAEIVSKDDGEPVRFGNHSLKVTFDFSGFNNSSNGNCYLRTAIPTYTFEGTPTAVGAWIYIPEGIDSALQIYLQVANKNFSTAYGTVGATNQWTGWKYVELDLTDSNAGSNLGSQNAPFGQYQGNGIMWISYQPGKYGALSAAASIYVDNMQLIYGANTDDTENPLVNSINVDGKEIEDGKTVLESNVNTFRASYADADGKYATGIDFSEVNMLLDGVDVTDRCYINEGDEEIYFYDAELANGTHNIEIKVADKFGNETSETRYFKVKGKSESTQVALEPLDESPVLGSPYTLAVVADNSSDVKEAEISLKAISSFVQYWNDFSVVAGDNYDLVGEPKFSAKDNSISFKVQKKTDAQIAAFAAEPEVTVKGDNIIAKVIVNIPTDVPEGLDVTYRIAKGALTLESATGEKYVSSFSGKLTTTCASPFVITCEPTVVGSAGANIIVKDLEGKPVEGVNIYTDTGVTVGVTDENGKVFTSMFADEIQQFNIYAEKDGKLSFILSTQSYNAGGDETGAPTYIKLNATKKPASQQNITWMSSPLASAEKAVVEYATKADYEANGEETVFKTFEGNSILREMNSAPIYTSNYAVRVNSATVTGLKAATEYVYRVGDGVVMSELKTFKTTRNGQAVNFFVIGDTQATDTTNTDEITKNLAASDLDFSFGIQTGDAVDNGGNYTMWANIAKVFSGDFLGNQNMIQVLGNHEYYGDATAANSAAYYSLPNTNDDGSAPLYYSVQYGNVYVAVINYANLSDYEQAAKWLVEDANNSTATWKILTMHQPAYVTNPSGSAAGLKDIVVSAVDEAGIDVVFSGHDHSYARTERVTGGEIDKENGAVYYICGSTGEKSYPIIPNDDYHFAMLDGDYNAIYLTASATDTSLEITTREYTESGEDIIIDTCSIEKDIKCDGTKHDYVHEDGVLTCSVCGFSIESKNYSGFAKDAATGKNMYFVLGEAKTGWLFIGDDAYYFDENGIGVTGKKSIDGVTYTFTEESKQAAPVFHVCEDGETRVYVAGEPLHGWQLIDGDYYYLSTNSGRLLKGTYDITFRLGDKGTFKFDKNTGKLLDKTIVTTKDGVKACYFGPEMLTGWQEVDGTKYYFDTESGVMVTGEAEIDGSIYAFSNEGKFLHEGAHDWDGDQCQICGLNTDGTFTSTNKFVAFFQRIFRSIRDLFQRIFGIK